MLNRIKYTDEMKCIDHVIFWGISQILSVIFVFGLLKLPQDAPFSQFAQSSLGHALMLFVFVPFVLRLPKGKTTYREYLAPLNRVN